MSRAREILSKIAENGGERHFGSPPRAPRGGQVPHGTGGTWDELHNPLNSEQHRPQVDADSRARDARDAARRAKASRIDDLHGWHEPPANPREARLRRKIWNERPGIAR